MAIGRTKHPPPSWPFACARRVGIAAFSLVVLVFGYLVVAALFYGMVYRPSQREKRATREDAARDRTDDD
jgi:hypothetical protein